MLDSAAEVRTSGDTLWPISNYNPFLAYISHATAQTLKLVYFGTTYGLWRQMAYFLCASWVVEVCSVNFHEFRLFSGIGK